MKFRSRLPDYDHYVSVFDYYVDDSGEWDNWEARLLELTYADSLDLLDDVFVETVDTMRARFLMELVSSVDKNILLVGPRGCGKTCMINDFYSNKNDKNTLVKRIAYSAGTTASELQKFMESVVYHRQGLYLFKFCYANYFYEIYLCDASQLFRHQSLTNISF